MPSGIPIRAIGPATTQRQITGTSAVPILFTVVTEAATSTYYIFNKTAPRGLRVVDMWAYASGAGGAADTVQILNNTTAITNAIDLNVADNTRVATGTLDDAQQDIEQGGTLTVETASGAVARVYVLCVWKD